MCYSVAYSMGYHMGSYSMGYSVGYHMGAYSMAYRTRVQGGEAAGWAHLRAGRT